MSCKATYTFLPLLALTGAMNNCPEINPAFQSPYSPFALAAGKLLWADFATLRRRLIDLN
ncbi:hypothetical protein RvY_14643 [Ramazzottius varieornatus]|uniref:Uncharacterized protein n=1 Tax=Ramazzottius varieornatus TaxID=947166 RepID=A0A1D1VZA4_RAMVA|nr:hypothetical protein RvY_14643 [Ramazzottius varieornatus]